MAGQDNSVKLAVMDTKMSHVEKQLNEQSAMLKDLIHSMNEIKDQTQALSPRIGAVEAAIVKHVSDMAVHDKAIADTAKLVTSMRQCLVSWKSNVKWLGGIGGAIFTAGCGFGFFLQQYTGQ